MEEDNLTKGASIKYVRKIFGILDPLPPIVRFSRNLSVLSYAKIGHIFDTPLPLSAYVLNGSPLTRESKGPLPSFFLKKTTGLH